MAYDEATAERVRRALARQKGIVEKKLMGGLSFMADDVMCCSVIGGGGLLIRVIPETREALLREAHAQTADMRGRQMTGFIRVLAEGYRKPSDLKKWIDRGLAAPSAIAADKPAARPTKVPAPKKAKKPPVRIARSHGRVLGERYRRNGRS